MASVVFVIGGYMMALELGGYKLDMLEATLYTVSLYLFLEVAYYHTLYLRFATLKGVVRSAVFYIVGTSLLFFMLTLTIGFVAGGASLVISFVEFSRLVAIISTIFIVGLTAIFIVRLLQKPPRKWPFFIL
ncbi:MAG: hypothetical protein HY731_07450 [Candidatus Tectomicrobia bacterium]|nr:hypothetical protein [Candidatus Tectomicrobia bacterium]